MAGPSKKRCFDCGKIIPGDELRRRWVVISRYGRRANEAMKDLCAGCDDVRDEREREQAAQLRAWQRRQAEMARTWGLVAVFVIGGILLVVGAVVIAVVVNRPVPANKR